jgi:hypothetical protein
MASACCWQSGSSGIAIEAAPSTSTLVERRQIWSVSKRGSERPMERDDAPHRLDRVAPDDLAEVVALLAAPWLLVDQPHLLDNRRLARLARTEEQHLEGACAGQKRAQMPLGVLGRRRTLTSFRASRASSFS